MKKAKTNIFCNGVQYVKGQVYSNKEVTHLDLNDFEDIAEPKTFTDTIENKIVANPDTKVSVKTKKTK
jgi:hypothetical protein